MKRSFRLTKRMRKATADGRRRTDREQKRRARRHWLRMTRHHRAPIEWTDEGLFPPVNMTGAEVHSVWELF